MKIIEGDITDIDAGIIVHQVNCKGAFGAGVSGVIAKKWPKVERQYRALCANSAPQNLFGTPQVITINDDLHVVNLFTQMDYGDSKRTGRIYTDMDELVWKLQLICNIIAPSLGASEVYVPYGIGCGLAGGDWDTLTVALDALGIQNITAVKLPGA